MAGRLRLGALAAALALVAAGGWWWFARDAAPPPARERAAVPVVLAEAAVTRLVREIAALGTVVATESVTLAAEIAGRITAIHFEEGGHVAAGDVLVELDPAAAEAELRGAEAEAAELAQQLARGSQLAARGFAPRGDVDDLRRRLEAARAGAAAARVRLDRTRILAPFDGRIGLREVSLGALVQPGATLATLDAVDPVDVRFALPERDAARIAPGSLVAAEADALPGRVVEGRVRVLGTRIDPALRTIPVDARLPNPDGALKPGMLLRLRVAAEVVEAAVTVPPPALQLRGPERFVFTVQDGIARRVPVQPGERRAGLVEIREGLPAGTPVVVEGLQGLEDGARVAVQPGAPAGRAPGLAAR